MGKELSKLEYWCQKILPAVYDDSLSYYELLAKIVDKLNETLSQVNVNTGNIAVLRADVDELTRLFKEFVEHGFDDYYKAQVEKWIDEHMRYVYEHTVKMVFFGLTLDGHFCAYVPDSWRDIIFDTGMVYGTVEYGRLILKYNVDGPGVIDNTGEGTSLIDLINRVTNNERAIARNNDTLYTGLRGEE